MTFRLSLILLSLCFTFFTLSCGDDEAIDSLSPMVEITNPFTDMEVFPVAGLNVRVAISDNEALKNATIRITDRNTNSVIHEWTQSLSGTSVVIDTIIYPTITQEVEAELTVTVTDVNANTGSDAVNFTFLQPGNAVNLNFKLTYDGSPLVMYEEKDFDGIALLFSRISFFISDVTLYRSGTEEEILEVDYIDLSPDHEDVQSAMEGTDYVITNVPEGDYDGIRFGIGVPATLNAMDPLDFATDHPLYKNAAEHWAGWKSYIFFKIEGKYDGDNSGTVDDGMALHGGSDTTYRTINKAENIQITLTDIPTVDFTIDLKELLSPSGGIPYDLLTTPQIHSLNQIDEAMELADNLSNAIQ